jgi:hypothetical protein
MSGPLPLPQELLDFIIDFLFDDKQSLKACSLTCRAFLSASRLHIFTQMHLQPERFSSFMASSPSVVPFVQSLRFDSTKPKAAMYLSIQDLNMLPNLKSLTVKGSAFHPHLPPPLAESWCTQIACLSMESQGFSDFYQFARFIVLFTSLERLSMKNMLWFGQSIPDLHQRLPSTLRTLDLQQCSISQLFEWILCHDPIPSLHTLALTYQNSNQLSLINEICSSLHSSLKHFELITPTGFLEPRML